MTVTDWIQAGAMVVLVGVTAYYAIRTHKMSNDTKEQVKVLKETVNRSIRPYIYFDGTMFTNHDDSTVFDFPSIPKIIYLNAHNAGTGPAINLDIQCFSESEYDSIVKREIPSSRHYHTHNLSLIKSGEYKGFNFVFNPNEDHTLFNVYSLFIVAFYEDVSGQYWETIHSIRFASDKWVMCEIVQTSSSLESHNDIYPM